MTEPQNDATPVPVPVPADEPANPYAVPAEAQPQRPVRPFNRRKAGIIAGAVAFAVLASGAVWGVYALKGADRTAPTRYWAAGGAQPEKSETPAAVPLNDLSGKLLPMPRTFKPGPDLGGDGNNFFVSGENAVKGFKDSRKGLSTTERNKRDEALAGLKLKGLAGRSYTENDHGMVAEVRIMQADPQALGEFSAITKKLFEITGDDRDAPKVEGFPDAKCSLFAIGEEKEEKIDSLDCVAVQGDVLVNFRAYGPKPFSGVDAAAFFKNQLTHLKSPGESV